MQLKRPTVYQHPQAHYGQAHVSPLAPKSISAGLELPWVGSGVPATQMNGLSSYPEGILCADGLSSARAGQ